VLVRGVTAAERESQADENCDWLYLQLRALDGDEAARAKTEPAARERWPSFAVHRLPCASISRPGGYDKLAAKLTSLKFYIRKVGTRASRVDR
jgi:hypothetical protein